MKRKKIGNIHPGEILLEEFLKPLNLSQNYLARQIGVSPRRINEIVLGKRSVTADTSARLAKFFDMSDEFFLRLQVSYDMEEAKEVLAKDLAKIHPFKMSLACA